MKDTLKRDKKRYVYVALLVCAFVGFRALQAMEHRRALPNAELRRFLSGCDKLEIYNYPYRGSVIGGPVLLSTLKGAEAIQFSQTIEVEKGDILSRIRRTNESYAFWIDCYQGSSKKLTIGIIRDGDRLQQIVWNDELGRQRLTPESEIYIRNLLY
jgi:hypothetical protein